MPRQRPTRAPAPEKNAPCGFVEGGTTAPRSPATVGMGARRWRLQTTPVGAQDGSESRAQHFFLTHPYNPFLPQWLTYWVVYSLYGLVEGALRLTKW